MAYDNGIWHGGGKATQPRTWQHQTLRRAEQPTQSFSCGTPEQFVITGWSTGTTDDAQRRTTHDARRRPTNVQREPAIECGEDRVTRLPRNMPSPIKGTSWHRMLEAADKPCLRH
ncbi:hypothetical protein E4U54_002241 [Claviceps lovelessii]|nr:hypothetical protein E4U54_002241 [Claviceps lovelessii]